VELLQGGLEEDNSRRRAPTTVCLTREGPQRQAQERTFRATLVANTPVAPTGAKASQAARLSCSAMLVVERGKPRTHDQVCSRQRAGTTLWHWAGG